MGTRARAMLPVLAALLAVAGAVRPSGAAEPVAIVAEYDGIIQPVAAEFIDDVIARADASGATVTVIVLRTPGGLLDSTRTIVSRIVSARAPVVVFVGPAGARAASAGFLITLAADVAVMAPGTHIGAAHPVTGGGEPVSATMAKKVESDATAYARSLAESRGRNADLAAKAVIESRAFTAREAASATPALVDLVADDVRTVLDQIDGRSVRRVDGRIVTLHTKGIRIERVEMSWRQRFLSAIAHPQIAYLLLTIGMIGLMVELWNPGAVLPGVVGSLSLLLAFFAFQVLPVNTTGLLLIALGITLLVLELKVPSFGLLGVGGTVSLFIGSVMLTRDVPGVRVGYTVIAPAVLAMAGIMLALGRLAFQSQRIRATTGVEGLIGETGRAIQPLGPDRLGHVRVHGEIWRAVSPSPLAAGCGIRITAVDGLTLRVEADAPPPGEETLP